MLRQTNITRAAERAQTPVFHAQDEVIIAVMGATGSGKSTFINLLSGSHLAVGTGIRSCTCTVQTGNSFELFGRSIVLVDTPGFDDTTISDTDILKMIAVYLSTAYWGGQKLSGVVYIHRISDLRVGGIARRNFTMFRKLCGDASLKNVVIMTNMWGRVSNEEGEAREQQLRTDDIMFKPVLENGASMLRHDGTLSSAQTVLQHIVNNCPAVLQIQRELVDEGKDITRTAAGEELNRELMAMAKKHAEQLAEVQKEMEEALAAKDMETKRALEEVRKELKQNVNKIQADRERLSREYQEERNKAEERMRKAEAALAEEKKAREAQQNELQRLKLQLEERKRAEDARRAQLQAIKELFGKTGRECDKAPFYIVAFHQRDRVRTIVTLQDHEPFFYQLGGEWAKIIVEVPVDGPKRVLNTFGSSGYVGLCMSETITAPLPQSRFIITYHEKDCVRMAVAAIQTDAESVYAHISNDWAKVLMEISTSNFLKTYGLPRYVEICKATARAIPIQYRVAYHEQDRVRVLSTFSEADAGSAYDQISREWAKVSVAIFTNSQVLSSFGGNRYIEQCTMTAKQRPLSAIQFTVAFHERGRVKILGAYNQADAQSMYYQISREWAKVLTAVPSDKVIATFGGSEWIGKCKEAVTALIRQHDGKPMM